MGDARGVVARIPPPEDRIGDDRGPQRILRIEIGAPDPLVDNGLKAFIARERAGLSPFDEDGDNARVLTDRSADMRLLVRIWAMASRAAGDSSSA
jgi:hypothetical protein